MPARGGQVARQLLPIHEEILRILSLRKASYAAPIPSVELASALNVAPSYIRQQVAVLRALRMVGVRRGRGGGYYLRRPLPETDGPEPALPTPTQTRPARAGMQASSPGRRSRSRPTTPPT